MSTVKSKISTVLYSYRHEIEEIIKDDELRLELLQQLNQYQIAIDQGLFDTLINETSDELLPQQILTKYIFSKKFTSTVLRQLFPVDRIDLNLRSHILKCFQLGFITTKK